MIEIKNLCAGYGKENIIENITFKAEKGKLISLIGPNGSGKSTLLKAMLGIINNSSGEVYIDGVKLVKMRREDIAKKIAYLPQGKNTPDMTVMQMVLHGRFPHLKYPRRYSDKDREIAINAMKQTGIEKLSDKPLSVLSGGMRQRAYISMALAQNTDYILLDEPTTYLDIENQLSLMELLSCLADNGKGIVAVMHDLPMAFSFSDYIGVIKDGKLVSYDTPKNLYEKNKVSDIFKAELKFSESENTFYYKYK